MKKIVALLLLASSSLVFAADYPRDITLSWTNPSQYTDGSLIEQGDLDSVRVECFRNGVPTFTATVPDTGEGVAQTETFVQAVPQPGTYTCVAYAIVVDGIESDPSNAASKKYTGKPLPPQEFK